MVMDVYILRHGKAEARSTGVSGDAGRRLTESGRREMGDVAAGIVSLGIMPRHVISSPLVRAKETASIVIELLSKAGSAPRIAIWPELKPESNILETHRRLINMAPDTSIMLVGHEPHLSSLASSMALSSGAGDNLLLNLKKGGVIMVRGSASGPMIRGSMRYMMTPRQLRMCRRAKDA